MELISHEDHEALLGQLNDPEISAEDRTDILTQLRNHHTTTLEQFSELQTSEQKLKASNDDLLKANAKLFNESGYIFGNADDPGAPPEPSVSETITLEDMESKYRQH